ncbi:MAG: type II secretion system minor pseudopilin GspI [Nevskia sp.]|nr:type II secretion system minor pseudopilin GspI [Nevskia sp.]
MTSVASRTKRTGRPVEVPGAPPRTRFPAAGGFTLLEVLVTVAVLAIALGAIIVGAANYAKSAAYLRDKTLALWVAHNRLTEIELQPVWPDLGKSDDDVKMGNQDWTWHAEVVKTPDDNLRRVILKVEKKGDPSKTVYAELNGFVSKIGRKTSP